MRVNMGRWTTGLLSLVLVAMLATGAIAQDAALVVKAGKIIPLAGAPISPGQILVRDGKIAEIGATVTVPDGAQVIDAPDAVVIPGLVAAFTTLAERDRNSKESVTPETRMADGLDLFGDWREPLSGGVTTIYLSPPDRRLVPGQGAVAKLGSGGPSARVLSGTPTLRIVLGEWPKNPPKLWDPPLPPTPDNPSAPPESQLPTTRMGEIKLLREVFREAADATIAAALNGESLVRVKADRTEDIRNALALAEEFGLKIAVEGGREAHLMAASLARRNVPVILSSTIRPGLGMGADLTDTKVSGQARADSAAILIAAGVKVAIATDDTSIPEILTAAAWAVGNGAPVDAALRAITSDAAIILGVDASVGTLEAGKDADLIILTGDPFATQTVVQTTISDGRVAYERRPDSSADTALAPLRILRAATVVTGSGGQISPGEVWVRGGTIERVGAPGDAPADAQVIDLGDRVVMPGMIDMQSRLGLHWESEEPTLSPRAASSGQSSGGPKHVSIANAIDPTDDAFAEALRAGVTSIVLAPSDAGLFCGSVAVVKTAGATIDQRIVKPIAALKFSLRVGRDRQAQPWGARDFLDKAEKYDSDWAEFDSRWAEFERKYQDSPEAELKDIKEPARPARNTEMEMLRALVAENLPVMVSADRADEITQALEVFASERGYDVMILGAADAWRLTPEMREAGAFAATDPDVLQDERGRDINAAGLLADADVPVAFQSGATSGTQFLRATAAYAVRHGMDETEAIRALTTRPAEFLKLDGRIGCFEPGRDADIVVLSGDPLELTSRVEQVYVDGALVYDAAAQ